LYLIEKNYTLAKCAKGHKPKALDYELLQIWNKEIVVVKYRLQFLEKK
jgi:hypothetical protein